MSDIKIGEFVKEHIDNIIKYCEEKSGELHTLEDKKYSKEKFDISYSFFKKALEIDREDEGINIKTQTASYRYWKDEYSINNEKYRVCSQWYKKNIKGFLAYLNEKQIFLNKYENLKMESQQFYSEIENKKFIQIKNIILYGSPGVGKTHNTNQVIQLIENGKSEKEIFEFIKNNEFNESIDISDIKERVKFITFHQSFGYEDFIEGFRPNEEGKIELQDGIFKEICKHANADSDNAYYLVIDEINRGNISKIFGELITLIEEDKRDKLEVTLPYSKQLFKIPSNLYIIGTMNSTDKSIALIDIALRRRFTFLKMKPNVELVPTESRELFKNLNEYISKTLGEDYQIGHSYFMGAYDLDFVLEYKIKPLLEEYFYGDDKSLKEVLDLIENN